MPFLALFTHFLTLFTLYYEVEVTSLTDIRPTSCSRRKTESLKITLLGRYLYVTSDIRLIIFF